MAKSFAPRLSKKERRTVDLSDKISKDVFKMSDQKLLRGAKLQDVKLAQIKVKEQVRTKFNDSSIKELAENIKTNGLIQPLVVHREGHDFVLICGERRFRAMSSIKMEMAPCFILEGKSEQELMAIQFSENSSREDLHYIDKADGIYSYKVATGASERKITQALGISKSEVHRSLLLGKLPEEVKESAKKFNIEKYVLLEWDAIEDGPLRKKILNGIIAGTIKKRAQLKKLTQNKIPPKSRAKTKATSRSKKATLPKDLKTLIKGKGKDMKLDKETQAMLKSLLESQN